jgi:plasmid stabilization system protein ParE
MTGPHLRRIVWTERAVRELEAIGAYVEAVNPLAAQRLTTRLIAAAEALVDYPQRFRSAGLDREVVAVKPYVIRCRVDADRVLILRVRHGARRPLPGARK